MRIFIASFLFVILCLGGFSCTRCGDHASTTPYYSITKLSIAVLAYDPLGRPSVVTPLDTSYTVDWNDLYLAVNADRIFHACNNLPFSFGTLAYACKELQDGERGSIEKIDKLLITSDQDFDSAHVAGTKLNEFFVTSYSQSGNFESLNSVTTHFPTDPPISLSLMLSKKPAVNKLRFFIQYHLTNGKTLNASTPELTLN